MRIMVGVMLLMIVGAIGFAVFEPIQVLPRMRLGPGYALADAQGETVTSESVRGTVTLYSFAGDTCDEPCEDSLDTMRTVQERVENEIDFGGVDFQLVTISAEPTIAADEPWTVLSGTPDQLETVVSAGFQRHFSTDDQGVVSFDGGFVLVDGSGIIRGDYRYQTLADDADKLVRHISLLAAEIRNSGGASSVAYETAHLFLCYP